jgi:hypothetical protein
VGVKVKLKKVVGSMLTRGICATLNIRNRVVLLFVKVTSNQDVTELVAGGMVMAVMTMMTWQNRVDTCRL